MADLTTKKKSRGGNREAEIERRKLRSRREIGSKRPRIGRRVRRRTEKRNKASETCSGREIRTIEDKFYAGKALQEDMEASGKIGAELQECVILIENTLTSGAETSDAPSTSNASIPESNTSTPQPTNIKARLPKLEVRIFNGKVHEWQEFWDSFQSAIHDNAQLSDVDKFCYLRGLIEGPVKATIAGFSLTADNYNTAVELLERRFGKKVAIERAHVSQLLNVQPVYSAKDVRGLRIFHDTVETHYH